MESKENPMSQVIGLKTEGNQLFLEGKFQEAIKTYQ